MERFHANGSGMTSKSNTDSQQSRQSAKMNQLSGSFLQTKLIQCNKSRCPLSQADQLMQNKTGTGSCSQKNRVRSLRSIETYVGFRMLCPARITSSANSNWDAITGLQGKMRVNRIVHSTSRSHNSNDIPPKLLIVKKVSKLYPELMIWRFTE